MPDSTLPDFIDFIDLLAPFLGGYIVYFTMNGLKYVVEFVGRLTPALQRSIVLVGAFVLSGIGKFFGIDIPLEHLTAETAALAMIFHSGNKVHENKVASGLKNRVK